MNRFLTPEKYFKILGWYFHNAYKIWASPFDWNFDNERLKTSVKSCRQFAFTRIIPYLHGAYLALYSTYCRHTGQLSQSYILYAYLIALAVTLLASVPLSISTREIVAAFNGTLDFIGSLKSTKSNIQLIN